MIAFRRLLVLLAMFAVVGPTPSGAAAPAPPAPYWVNGPQCGEDDCDNIPGRWRALAPADLYDAPGGARRVARLASGEWVRAVEKKTLVTPLRGEVRIAGAGLAVGDVVYGPFQDAQDGVIQVLRGGLRLTIDPDAETPRIDWASPSSGAPSRVMWVRVKRAGGRGGWLRDPADFACMGDHPAEDEGC